MSDAHRAESSIPRVKVCGLTTAQVALAAVEAGADAIGVVHYPPSTRHLDAEAAARVFTALPAEVMTVAVMVDAEPSPASEWARRVGARAVQLCGGERPEDWRGFELPILRRLPVATDAEAEVAAWSGLALAFVLDHPASAGGSGRTVDHVLAAALARKAPCLLAGGLDEANVCWFI